jgi:phage head maturation protease
MGARKTSSRVGSGGSVGSSGEQFAVDEPRRVATSIPGEAPGATRIGFAPIVRVDAPRREIELCATSEAVDSHGTIFDYDASKEAFTRWIGNVREMHGRQAVGSRVAVRCDDESRRIFVRIRISRGAQDTWEKVLDGTLRGASIGASAVVWQRQRRRVAGEQRWLSVATRYDLVELSLVDNPSNPDALGVSFVRDATPDVAMLDPLDESDEPLADGGDSTGIAAPPEALGGMIGQDTPHTVDSAQAERATQARLHGAARAVLTGCGCSSCAAAQVLLDDAHSSAQRMTQPDDQPFARALAAGLSNNADRLVAVDAGVRALAATIEVALQQMAGEVGGLSRRMAALESQPLAGGPVARPMEKASAFAPRGMAESPTAADQYRALESLAGKLSNPQAQVAVAAEMIRMQQQGE